MKQTNFSRINKTIENRISMTERAGKSIDMFRNNSKDDFYKKNETKTSFIDDRKDHMLDRAKARYNKNEYLITNVISRMIPVENTKTAKYYSAYVK
jgi:hypothetical protein